MKKIKIILKLALFITSVYIIFLGISLSKVKAYTYERVGNFYENIMNAKVGETIQFGNYSTDSGQSPHQWGCFDNYSGNDLNGNWAGFTITGWQVQSIEDATTNSANVVDRKIARAVQYVDLIKGQWDIMVNGVDECTNIVRYYMYENNVNGVKGYNMYAGATKFEGVNDSVKNFVESNAQYREEEAVFNKINTAESPCVQNKVDNKVCLGPFHIKISGHDLQSVAINNRVVNVEISQDINRETMLSYSQTKWVPFYIWVDESYIGNGNSVTVKFTQEAMYQYYAARVVMLQVQGLGQCYIAYKGSYVTPTSKEVDYTVATDYISSLEIDKKDSYNENQIKDAKFAIQFEGDGKWLKEDGTYSDNKSDSVISSYAEIDHLRRGTYHIYEIVSGVGYDITKQDGYNEENEWVDYGTVEISGPNTKKLSVGNQKWVNNITGLVWEDNSDEKENEALYKYVSESNDKLLEGIKVEVLKDGKVVQNKNGDEYVTTDKEGKYTFELDKQILYWELNQYVVRFTYDNETYTVVPINVDAKEQNVSRAIENYDWEKDELAEGTGFATVESDMSKYYNENTYSIEGINLGLMTKVNDDFNIEESIEAVTLIRGEYKYTYKYGDASVVEENENTENVVDGVAVQTGSNTFTQKIYPSDIAYNSSVTDDDEKFKVYVDYNITITNTQTTDSEEIYQEKSLNIKDLQNEFDTSIYELADENWKTNDSYAIYNPEENEDTDVISNIESTKSVTIPITFKVTENGLNELVYRKNKGETSDIYKDAITKVKAIGYHNYQRRDYSWIYSQEGEKPYSQVNTHKTNDKEKESSALALRLYLNAERTISGNVFEDTQTEESANDGTRVGNGQYEDTENKIENVKVELINASTKQVSKSYKGKFLTYNSVTKKWKLEDQNAECFTDSSGNYKLEGVVPGEYYLRFTYSNGTQIIVNNNPENINLSEYKSTILSGYVAENDKKDDDQKSDEWFLKSMDEGVGIYSIATDKYYSFEDYNQENKTVDATKLKDAISFRTTSDEEINYSSVDKYNQGSIMAYSNKMNIQFEYTSPKKDKSNNKYYGGNYDENYPSTLNNMSFGIIERPHVDITLDKTINSVKITLQNGTVIVDGNPSDSNVSPYLTNLGAENASSYAKVETEVSELYGSVLEAKLDITITNRSELDYATNEFYKYGTVTSSDTPITTTVTKVIDYVADESTSYMDGLAETTVNKIGPTYFTQDVLNDNKSYKSAIINEGNSEIAKPLEPLKKDKSNEENAQTTYSISLNKLLSIEQDDIGINSYAEIIGMKNVTFTRQYKSTSGNYDLTNISGTTETDNGSATVAVTPETGANKNNIYLIATVIGLIVIAGGFVLIKKKVLK